MVSILPPPHPTPASCVHICTQQQSFFTLCTQYSHTVHFFNSARMRLGGGGRMDTMYYVIRSSALLIVFFLPNYEPNQFYSRWYHLAKQTIWSGNIMFSRNLQRSSFKLFWIGYYASVQKQGCGSWSAWIHSFSLLDPDPGSENLRKQKKMQGNWQ